MTTGRKQQTHAHRPLERISWNEIREPGAYVEIATGTLYRVPRQGATPLVETHGAGPLPADTIPPRHSEFVRVSRDPFILSLGARLICVDHGVQRLSALDDHAPRPNRQAERRGGGRERRDQRQQRLAGGRVATVGFGLTYRGTDPQTVADVTNALAGLYVERNSTIRERQASGTASFLKAQLTEQIRVEALKAA